MHYLSLALRNNGLFNVLVLYAVCVSLAPSPVSAIDDLLVSMADSFKGGDMIEVTAEQGRIMSGSTVLASVPRGTRLWAFEFKDKLWAKVKVLGEEQKGWMFHNQLRVLPLTAAQLKRTQESYLRSLNVMNGEGISEESPMARFAEGERRHLELCREVLGEDHPLTFGNAINLASTYRRNGRYYYLFARPILEKLLAIETQVLGETDYITLVTAHRLGLLLLGMGDFAAAESLYERAVTVNQRIHGDKHRATLYSMYNLGVALNGLGEYNAAREVIEKSLEIWLEEYGVENEGTLELMNGLAESLSNLGELTEAKNLLDAILTRRLEALGKQSLETCKTMNQLADVLSDLGDLEAARTLHEEVLARQEEVLGLESPDRLATVNSLANVLGLMGHESEAAGFYQSARQGTRRMLVQLLPELASHQQLKFLQTHESRGFGRSLSFAMNHTDNGGIVSLSAGWVANGKAVAHEASTQQVRLLRDSRAEHAEEKMTELLAIRSELAQLSLSVAPPDRTSLVKQQLSFLMKREADLSRALPFGKRNDQDDTWCSGEKLRMAIPHDSVIIDIARFQYFDFMENDYRSRWKEPVYVAWIVPPAGQGEITIVNLGEAEAIEDAVGRVRAGLDDPTKKILDRGEPEIEQELSEPLKHLASLVLDPLLAEIGEAKHLILSPDASLWLVPWAALPLNDGRYAVEEYRIHYVISGRDLVTHKPQAQLATSRPLIMADPDFDLDPSQANAETLALLDTSFGLRSSGSMDKLQAVPRLPATAVEAKEITPSLQRYSQAEPRVYTGAQALEGVFKAASRPQVVTLSTHGFFFDDQRTRPADRMDLGETRSAVLTVEGDPMENPLLRCGLLLAGCNQRDKIAEGQDDGVLTGLEIVGTDLRGTELVVLSACETGIGDVQNGEGVAGLRQAFQLAGARSVVASLWSVPDVATGQLMRDFFEELADGQTKADALRNSQLAQIASRRKLSGAAHPFFWAAFTLTGN